MYKKEDFTFIFFNEAEGEILLSASAIQGSLSGMIDVSDFHDNFEALKMVYPSIVSNLKAWSKLNLNGDNTAYWILTSSEICCWDSKSEVWRTYIG